MKKLIVLLLFLGCVVATCFAIFSTGNKKADQSATISTSYGDIHILLHGDTPLHTNNFISLCDSGFYDSLLFHRIINDFMIQAGDPLSKHAHQNQMLGQGGVNYTIPQEISHNHIHKKGAIAAARLSDNVNPQKASSGCQFYIVEGSPVTLGSLKQREETIITNSKNRLLEIYLAQIENKKILDEINDAKSKRQFAKYDSLILSITEGSLKSDFAKLEKLRYSAKQIQDYITMGGTPHLDGDYTVFGEVISGWEIIDSISNSTVDRMSRPIVDIQIISIKVKKRR